MLNIKAKSLLADLEIPVLRGTIVVHVYGKGQSKNVCDLTGGVDRNVTEEDVHPIGPNVVEENVPNFDPSGRRTQPTLAPSTAIESCCAAVSILRATLVVWAESTSGCLGSTRWLSRNPLKMLLKY
jgi:hypothetical protein